METPSLVLMSNQEALQRAMDIVANNVANASTTGFKREAIQFDTLLTQPAPGQYTAFVADGATYRDTSNGPVQMTGNPLDLALQGDGYFAVQTADGVRYTRNGSFQLNSQGQIVTLSGDPVLGQGNQPITVPDTTFQINIASDGDITARVDNGASLLELGKLTVDKFANEQGLQATGGGLYTTDQVPQSVQDPGIVEGALEQSNVQPVTEITDMIKIMRAYEQAVNMIGDQNQRLDQAIDKLSKTTA
ncbi:MAG TPA: flagellar basal-body rod protein FlgF [Alphaproteobacteria bacterium]|nr:flagellar basal-body rod protein FlgF [Alphaproteobacteria bacterium]